jgi:hypothetical protein
MTSDNSVSRDPGSLLFSSTPSTQSPNPAEADGWCRRLSYVCIYSPVRHMPSKESPPRNECSM